MKKRAKKQHPGPGISRIDQPSTRTHGYFVRVGYRRTVKGWRPKHSSFFGDASHRGAAGALRAARAWHKKVTVTPRKKSTTRKKSTARKKTARRTR